MDDATAQAASRHAEAQIEELPEPARTIAKLLLEAGRWAVSDPRETHAAPEARQ
jgi:hypothetical protein